MLLIARSRSKVSSMSQVIVDRSSDVSGDEPDIFLNEPEIYLSEPETSPRQPDTIRLLDLGTCLVDYDFDTTFYGRPLSLACSVTLVRRIYTIIPPRPRRPQPYHGPRYAYPNASPRPPSVSTAGSIETEDRRGHLAVHLDHVDDQRV